uniref:Solute carrier family 30 member 2 n=1 Tax=Cyclopterus lumpus TaxID=8103 RepID=A0A8C3G894_CYCLU
MHKYIINLIYYKRVFYYNLPLSTGSPDDEHSDSSEDASSEDALWRPDGLCLEAGTMSAAESEVRRSARRKLYLACTVCLLFMTGEVVGGYAAHSLAIMTDAAHLLTDFCSILISIFSLWLSTRPPTHTMTFGWHRAEILGMLLSMVSIWAVTAALVALAAQRIHDGDFDIDSRIMLVTSGCGVGVNVLMVLILHQSGASHGSGHHHSHGNAAVKAAFIHVLGDLVQSLGVLLAATIIYFWVSVGQKCESERFIVFFLFIIFVVISNNSSVNPSISSNLLKLGAR